MNETQPEQSAECASGQFGWNELLTSDVAASKKFYTSLFGWSAEPFGDEYTLFKQGDAMVGGLMKPPKPGVPTHWLAYVKVDDVDALASKAVQLGAKIVVPGMDIPDVGRIAVIVDPQGAPIGLYKSKM